MYTVASMSNTAGHGLPFVDASEVGMSAERLARIEGRFKTYVDESFLSGWLSRSLEKERSLCRLHVVWPIAKTTNRFLTTRYTASFR